MTISVVVVDDQALVRGGFSMILEAEPDIVVLAEAGDGAEAVRVCDQRAPDVVLMDVRMPVMDGIEATRRVTASGHCRVLVLTTFDLDEYVYDALRAGASGFLLKDVPPRRLADAVRTVAAGETLLAPTVTRRLVEEYVRRPAPTRADPQLQRVTQREREVLTLLGRGLSNAEIARRLYLSEATAKTHVSRILTKLDLRDRAQAVVLAYESGLVRPGDDHPTDCAPPQRGQPGMSPLPLGFSSARTSATVESAAGRIRSESWSASSGTATPLPRTSPSSVFSAADSSA